MFEAFAASARRPGARRRAAGLACVAAAVSLAGCSVAELTGTPKLPESPNVAEAPWPKLGETPALAPTADTRAGAERVGKGQDLEEGLADEAAQLRALDAEMRSQPVVRSNLKAEARRVRAQAARAAADTDG